ncbi:hypothetical protein LJC33_04955 [Eubacteriales bacterium OttesenSCG-928-N13]|nr:hypothetical protein [Eubacteriales bacterium OttesenSCG-928-N13]
MDNYRNVVKRRIWIYSALVICAVVAVVALSIWSSVGLRNEEAHLESFDHGMVVGLFAGLAAVMVVRILKYRQVLRDEGKLKALHIQENDERRLMINSKIGGAGYNIALGTILMAAIIATFIDERVGITLIAAATFMALLKAGLKIYYNKKY